MQFEYKRERPSLEEFKAFPDPLIEYLNRQGLTGWEVVKMKRERTGFLFIFKRAYNNAHNKT